MAEVQIVMPTGMLGASASDDLVDTAMRVIAVGFGDPNGWPAKYGTDYENDVFMMHRYCWCEKPDCLWCTIWLGNETDCSEAESAAHREKQKNEVRARYGDWAATRPAAPNFWFKPSGFQLRWYKYIGRDMEGNDADFPVDFMQQIFATHPTGMTAEQAIEEMARREEETSRHFQEMFASFGVKVG